jgi:hypothetical protein
MNCKCRSVDGLISNHHIPGLVHEDKVRDADLREVLREGVEPEMIREDGIPDGDVTRNALIETSICKSAGKVQWKSESKEAC